MIAKQKARSIDLALFVYKRLNKLIQLNMLFFI